jgi:hypothetical protein
MIADAERAARDEIDHAQRCFALAARYRDDAPGAGALDAGISPLSVDLVEVARAAFVEGCIGETLAAIIAAEQRDVASDAGVRAALTKIAADEARHAELSWRFVAWALERGGAAVRDATARALPDAARHAPAVVTSEDPALHAHGRLSAHHVRALERAALLDVVLPCAHALLAQPLRDAVAERLAPEDCVLPSRGDQRTHVAPHDA